MYHHLYHKSGWNFGLKTIEGVYRGGKIELAETPSDSSEGSAVIVTFFSSGSIDLHVRGINQAQAADLRARLAPFAEDWESPEMTVYDNYDACKANL
ncbi:MAG: hypothetical protein C4527_14510 [Candidatus Omnitrophota bacterium]|nr:MAG: hypothetical protein C4527_14510 [Candidatus Omnitrophota bacterium]